MERKDITEHMPESNPIAPFEGRPRFSKEKILDLTAFCPESFLRDKLAHGPGFWDSRLVNACAAGGVTVGIIVGIQACASLITH